MSTAIRLINIQSLGKKSREFLQENPKAKRVMSSFVILYFIPWLIFGFLHLSYGYPLEEITLDKYWHLIAVCLFGSYLIYPLANATLMHYTKQKTQEKPAYILASARFVVSRILVYLKLKLLSFFSFWTIGIVLSMISFFISPFITMITGIISFVFVWGVSPIISNITADEDIPIGSSIDILKEVFKRKWPEFIYGRLLFQVLWAIMSLLVAVPLGLAVFIGGNLISSFFAWSLFVIISIIVNVWFFTLLGIFQSNVYDLAKKEYFRELDAPYKEDEFILDNNYQEANDLPLELYDENDTFLGIDLEDGKEKKGLW